MDHLEESRLMEKTLILFSSDNGPESQFPGNHETQWCVGDTGGLRGRKRSLFDGGVCVPFIVHWTGKVPAGVINDSACLSSVDLFPTLLSMAGVELPDGYTPDGVNVSEALYGKNFKRKVPLMWEWMFSNSKEMDEWAKYAVRDEDYVLLLNPETGRMELYNTREDRSQVIDLAERFPEKVKELQQASLEWHQLLPRYRASDLD